jgi:hypothetical protein
MSGFRQFIIRTAEIFMVIVVVMTTLGFALAGLRFGGLFHFLLGGLFGFVLSSLLAAAFFLLAEIAENTRRA